MFKKTYHGIQCGVLDSLWWTTGSAASGAAMDAKIFDGNSITGHAKNGLRSLVGGLGF
ncbi:hypothetical protein [Streptococcus agalactiae]|uniref:hypothetical protein n=1 Tax=Streptococcus agalactiae TaxID=1311 RepID=UPI0002FE1C12|nr:hypothetical protein [Streptococcus agalactiae]AKI57434.1 Hypothetical Protein GBS85147_1006 [Streptococcus agalactiae]EPW72684.1 hypothetical protein SAG0101_03075 [Streptococcus agalactiae BSU451]MCC9941469.1 hypothetical protein [Streptococcus agalactiae]HEN0438318.1 hypothetical protein [Streptococcus agalactiae]HEO1986319.1 hypothetical protein [Streptococcus agalactiae]